MEGPDWNTIVSAGPGVLALIAAAVGYGRLQQRLTSVERDVEKLSKLSESVVRIDERTKSTENSILEIKQSVGDISRYITDGALGVIRRAQDTVHR